ncbi:MAG TPA: hypothetical protein PLP29_15230 [Candidatus Ozemobacteraceae bacterium]|mgnify:CR=1 FL=1|nr:hypothetical protein [Candidatus Ozemobacteraceae bacterium]
MKRLMSFVLMAALALPVCAEPFGGPIGHGHGQPGHGPATSGGHNGPGMPGGHGPSHPGNGGGYGPGMPGGHGPSMPGNGGGYGPGMPGGHGPSHPGNGGGYGPGMPGGHGPSMPGNGGGYGPGHPGNPGHPGHGPGMPGQMELRQAFLRIDGLFRLVEGSFYPGMDRRAIMECSRNMNDLSREISFALDYVPLPAVRDLQAIRRMVEQARYTLVTDFNPRDAHAQIRRAAMEFSMVSNRLIRR